MAKEKNRRGPRKQARRGDGSIYWDETNNHYVGSISLGYKPDGSRNRPSVRGKTQKEVRAKLKELKEDYDDGIDLGDKYTIEEAARDWLKRDVAGLEPGTLEQLEFHVEKHIIPALGKAKLKRLTADDVDDWLHDLRSTHSSSYINRLLGTLRRIIRFAESRNRVRRNVAALVKPPKGKAGRRSKALTLDQAKAILKASRGRWIHAYIALSLYTGVRTEEARPLKWEHTHLNPAEGEACSCGQQHRQDLPPHVEVWRSVRIDGDTKTRKSRRTIALPEFVIEIMSEYQEQQRKWRQEHDLETEHITYVFGTRYDTAQQAQVVRKAFRAVVAKAEVPGNWTPRELRHSFVSLMSDSGASDELIADLVGHSNTATTRTVYRHQLRPVITRGAELLDAAFGKGFLDVD